MSSPARTAPNATATDSDVRRTGLVWTALVALAWLALAAWRPTTTWHLAPLLLAAAWAWVVAQDLVPGDRSARRALVRAGIGGLLAATAVTLGLAAAGRLEGPTYTGSGSVVTEALLLALAGAAIAVLVGLFRARPTQSTATATLSETTLATSGAVVFTDGNAYFPADSVADGVLRPSSTRTVCPWKGIASYYDVQAGDLVIPDAAWTYRHPLPIARRVRGRVAFWGGIEITTGESRP